MDTAASADNMIGCDDPLPNLPAHEWRHLAALDPCTPAYVALQPTKQAPPWKWIPCKNGAPNCEEFEANWRTEFPGYFGGAWVAADAEGRMDRLGIMRLFDKGHPFGQGTGGREQDIYDIASGQPLLAMRVRKGPVSVYVDLGIGLTAVESFRSADTTKRAFLFGSRSAREISDGPTLPFRFAEHVAFQACFNLKLVVSTTLWACSDPEHRLVARMAVSTAKVVAQPTPRSLHLITVHGDDAYYRENRNDAGWARVIRFDDDGTLHPIRDPGPRHITSFATDGKTMFWLEGYGETDPYAPRSQPNVEAWSAPYTNDDATLAATAKRLATFEKGEFLNNYPGAEGVAFGGIYAVRTGPATLQLARASDGKTRTLRDTFGPDRDLVGPVGVTDSEVWALFQKKGTIAIEALARLGIGPW